MAIENNKELQEEVALALQKIEKIAKINQKIEKKLKKIDKLEEKRAKAFNRLKELLDVCGISLVEEDFDDDEEDDEEIGDDISGETE
jgi:hypothetical protein